METNPIFSLGDKVTVRVGQNDRTGSVVKVEDTKDGSQLVTVRYRAKNGSTKVTHQRSEWIKKEEG